MTTRGTRQLAPPRVHRPPGKTLPCTRRPRRARPARHAPSPPLVARPPVLHLLLQKTANENTLILIVTIHQHWNKLHNKNMFFLPARGRPGPRQAAITALAWRANDDDTKHLRQIFEARRPARIRLSFEFYVSMRDGLHPSRSFCMSTSFHPSTSLYYPSILLHVSDPYMPDGLPARS